MSEIQNRNYAEPEKLVSTDWLAEHLDSDSVRIVESNEDPLLYRSGHIPGAIEVDWIRDLNDPLRRDYITHEQFLSLLSSLGIGPDTSVVFYGDKNNWWACFALWIFELHGFTNTRILDGGRSKWQTENRPLTRDVPQYDTTEKFDGLSARNEIRALRDEVLEALEAKAQLVDVRSPEEFSGDRLHMPDYPNEGAVRGGHIPGAHNIPWAKAINPETSEFLSAKELEKLYLNETGFSKSSPTIAYCRIGERSSHTWFVLKYLLGFSDIKNYDGSWTEWGNSVGLPIEQSQGQ